MGLMKYSTRSIFNTLTKRFKSLKWKSSSVSDLNFDKKGLIHFHFHPHSTDSSLCRSNGLSRSWSWSWHNREKGVLPFIFLFTSLSANPKRSYFCTLRLGGRSFPCNPSSGDCFSLQTSANNMATTTQVNFDLIKEISLPLHTRSNTSGNEDYLGHGHNTEIPTDLKKVIETTSECLLNGGVLGVPTDTIYGIAGLAQNCKAVNRIYDIKQRNYSKPLAISVGKLDDIYRFCKVTVPRELLNDLLPGPVTVVFERSPELNPELNPQTSLVGVRIPNHIFMQTLAIACNGPIALTSANVSGDKSCLQIEEFKHLWPLLDLVVNGGKLNDSEESRLGSTVVDLSVEGIYRIIRPGSAYIATCAVLEDKFKLKEMNLEMSSSR